MSNAVNRQSCGDLLIIKHGQVRVGTAFRGLAFVSSQLGDVMRGNLDDLVVTIVGQADARYLARTSVKIFHDSACTEKHHT